MLDLAPQLNVACNFVEMHSDLLNIGVRINVFIYFHFS